MYSHQDVINERRHQVFSATSSQSLPCPVSRGNKDWLAIRESVSQKLPSIKATQIPAPVFTPKSSTTSSPKASVTSQENKKQRLRKLELMSKLDNLKDMTGIQLPSFSDETTLEELELMYTHYSRLVFVDKQVRTQKLYLIVLFICLEYGAEYSNLPAKGVSRFLTDNMGTLEQWLIMYAEKNYVQGAEELDPENINPIYCLLREVFKQIISFIGVLVLGNKINMNPDTSASILKAITTLFCESKYEYLLRVLISPNDNGEQIVKTSDHEFQEVILSLKSMWDQYKPMITGLVPGLGGLFGGGGGATAPAVEEPPRAPRPRAKRR